jgi:hypothetical protein
LARAALAEEQADCLLEAAGREEEASLRRISAAPCWENMGQYAQGSRSFALRFLSRGPPMIVPACWNN